MTLVGRFLCWLGFHKKYLYYAGARDFLMRFSCLRDGCYWAKDQTQERPKA